MTTIFRATRPIFPFSALVGQEQLKLALLLNAINPRLGGVLIRGEKGTAKSTAVRALSTLLPEIEVVVGCRFGCDPQAQAGGPASLCDECQNRVAAGETLRGVCKRVPLVELPVGATEDRVAGTLDLETAIKSGERRFEPGLLAAANRGILYVDEVNLLNDHLVDILLDAAAMGVNYVEREGVSVSHPAQFILVGTMNPEEGDLRPQLLDRFALAVEITGLPDPARRAQVVRRRIAFESDPAGFASSWRPTEFEERDRIARAQALLPQVRLGDPLLDLITKICVDFEVDGLRADIVMYKTATTLAAYHGRTRVTPDDVRTAAELALLHRRRRQPFEQPALDRERLDDALRRHAEPEDESSGSGSEGSSGGQGSSDPAYDTASDESRPDRVFEADQPYQVRALAAPPQATGNPRRGRRSKAKETPTGHYVRSTAPRADSFELAIDATVRAAAPHQRSRRARQPEGPALRLTPSDLRAKVRESKTGNLILFVVDASGSMGAQERMASVKGAILSLLLDAYQKRDQVGLIAFRGRQAELLLPPTNSVDLAERSLRELPTGGRTPLAHGLKLGWLTIERHLRKKADTSSATTTAPLLVLVSDGRPNVALAGGDPMVDAKSVGAEIRQRGYPSIVVDSETGQFKLGLAREVCSALGGRYLRLEDLAAGQLALAVRQAASFANSISYRLPS
ncbi:MAG: putative cobaltochelatase [Chloroflexi bacterium]|nr:putative cobaltochelatase [Chloroflexota bacterium]